MRRIGYSALVLASIFSSCNGGSEYGTFDGKVQTEWMPDGRSMRLLAPFAFTDPSGEIWEAPAGAIVDGASIPRFAWSIIGGPFTGRYRNASVIHDVACDSKSRPWESVHEAFYWAMRASGVKDMKAKVMYAAVYHFGPRWPEEFEVGNLSEEEVVNAARRALAEAPPGSKALIVDERGKIVRQQDVLGHRERTLSRLRAVRVAPPEPRITREQFENLETQIQQRAAKDTGGMTLEEIRAFTPPGG